MTYVHPLDHAHASPHDDVVRLVGGKAANLGVMARDLGLQLERRWLRRPITEQALNEPHFSATTDLYSVVANVYRMNIVPLSLRNLGLIAAATLLPFAPIELFAVSPIDLLKKLTGILL